MAASLLSVSLLLACIASVADAVPATGGSCRGDDLRDGSCQKGFSFLQLSHDSLDQEWGPGAAGGLMTNSSPHPTTATVTTTSTSLSPMSSSTLPLPTASPTMMPAVAPTATTTTYQATIPTLASTENATMSATATTTSYQPTFPTMSTGVATTTLALGPTDGSIPSPTFPALSSTTPALPTVSPTSSWFGWGAPELAPNTTLAAGTTMQPALDDAPGMIPLIRDTEPSTGLDVDASSNATLDPSAISSTTSTVAATSATTSTAPVEEPGLSAGWVIVSSKTKCTSGDAFDAAGLAECAAAADAGGFSFFSWSDTVRKCITVDRCPFDVVAWWSTYAKVN